MRDRCVISGEQAKTATEAANGRVSDREIDWAEVLDVALKSPGQLSNTYSRVHRYSFLNTILLLSQGARGPTTSYKGWQGLNRQVNKGERGYNIVRPITVKSKYEVDDEGKPKTFTSFKLVRGAFTYNQTSGEELPEPEIPTWDFNLALGRLAIEEVAYDHVDANCQGYATGRKIAVSPIAKFPDKTRAHEAAHVQLGHTANMTAGDSNLIRGVKEVQAESVAYLLFTELGLQEFFDPVESRGYIQHWRQDQELKPNIIRQIFSATDAILKAGYPEVEAAT